MAKYFYNPDKLKGSRTKSDLIKSIDSLLKSHARYCAYCGKPLRDLKEKTIDHVVPKSHSGPESGTNKVVCCYECNLRKANTAYSEFKNTVDKETLLKYLKPFKDLQLPTGEHYAIAILKKFRFFT